MEIQYVSDAVQSEGIQVKAMGFDATKTAKMFHMMSNSLYRNKPMAVLRELCSNAHDAHNEAGQAAPFSITAPTPASPVLVVKDCGTGLDLEKAKVTILQFLGSTKDESDEFIGGWGIGAKSPLSYANDYEVILRKGGYQWNVAVWKADFGVPDWAVTWEGPIEHGKNFAGALHTDGVEFRVPVKIQDLQLWRTCIQDYMTWTNYNVLAYFGSGEVVTPTPWTNAEEVEYLGAKFIVASRTAAWLGSSKLVYGGMAYEMSECMDRESDEYATWKRMESLRKSNMQVGVIVNTPNALNFTMSREDIEHTKKSQDFVQAVAAFFASNIGDTVYEKEDYSNLETLRQAKKAYEEELSKKVTICYPIQAAYNRLAKVFRFRPVMKECLLQIYANGNSGGNYAEISTGQEIPEIKVGISESGPWMSRRQKGAIPGFGAGVFMIVTPRGDESDADKVKELVLKELVEAGLPAQTPFDVISDEELKKQERREKARNRRRSYVRKPTITVTCAKTGERINVASGANLIVVDVACDEQKLSLLEAVGVIGKYFWPTPSFMKSKRWLELPKVKLLSSVIKHAEEHARVKRFWEQIKVTEKQLLAVEKAAEEATELEDLNICRLEKANMLRVKICSDLWSFQTSVTETEQLRERCKIPKPAKQTSKEAAELLRRFAAVKKTLFARNKNLEYIDMGKLKNKYKRKEVSAIAEVKRLKLEDFI